ncbi:MAG: L,D-transpeptidase [Xanthobacteraceae bacterium]|nr:MAG: L,D-transpeptidase [Xanthobacteraceae bacterium]
MTKQFASALIAGACLIIPCAASSNPLGLDPAERLSGEPQAAEAGAPVRVAYNERPGMGGDVGGNMGGGFIEFIFGGGAAPAMAPRYSAEPATSAPYIRALPPEQAMRVPDDGSEPSRPALDPRYDRQVIDYSGAEKPGTIIIDTPRRFLFLVQGNGRAIRYGIGVGRPGFAWAGVKHISQKREWPDWTPPPEMLRRRPDLPRHMEGGPNNPLGARAMYLGSSLYRIHGSNEPWTIGHAVSSGCIRMRNEDVIDLYGRVSVGARVVVI